MSIDIRAESRAIYLKDYFVSLRVDAPLSLSLWQALSVLGTK